MPSFMGKLQSPKPSTKPNACDTLSYTFLGPLNGGGGRADLWNCFQATSNTVVKNGR
jgi:hypothetical protein